MEVAIWQYVRKRQRYWGRGSAQPAAALLVMLASLITVALALPFLGFVAVCLKVPESADIPSSADSGLAYSPGSWRWKLIRQGRIACHGAKSCDSLWIQNEPASRWLNCWL